MPAAAMRPIAWSSSVLLPMPGSPPSSVTEPGTRPPPSTRSSSGTPVGRPAAAIGSTSASGITTPAAAVEPSATDDGRSSTRDDHAPHSVQRPSHFGAWASHSVQR